MSFSSARAVIISTRIFSMLELFAFASLTVSQGSVSFDADLTEISTAAE